MNTKRSFPYGDKYRPSYSTLYYYAEKMNHFYISRYITGFNLDPSVDPDLPLLEAVSKIMENSIQRAEQERPGKKILKIGLELRGQGIFLIFTVKIIF